MIVAYGVKGTDSCSMIPQGRNKLILHFKRCFTVHHKTSFHTLSPLRCVYPMCYRATTYSSELGFA